MKSNLYSLVVCAKFIVISNTENLSNVLLYWIMNIYNVVEILKKKNLIATN